MPNRHRGDSIRQNNDNDEESRFNRQSSRKDFERYIKTFGSQDNEKRPINVREGDTAKKINDNFIDIYNKRMQKAINDRNMDINSDSPGSIEYHQKQQAKRFTYDKDESSYSQSPSSYGPEVKRTNDQKDQTQLYFKEVKMLMSKLDTNKIENAGYYLAELYDTSDKNYPEKIKPDIEILHENFLGLYHEITDKSNYEFSKDTMSNLKDIINQTEKLMPSLSDSPTPIKEFLQDVADKIRLIDPGMDLETLKRLRIADNDDPRMLTEDKTPYSSSLLVNSGTNTEKTRPTEIKSNLSRKADEDPLRNMFFGPPKLHGFKKLRDIIPADQNVSSSLAKNDTSQTSPRDP